MNFIQLEKAFLLVSVFAEDVLGSRSLPSGLSSIFSGLPANPQVASSVCVLGLEFRH